MAQETQVEVAALPRLLIVTIDVDHDEALKAYSQQESVNFASLDFLHVYDNLKYLYQYLRDQHLKNKPIEQVVFAAQEMDGLCKILAQKVYFPGITYRIVLTSGAYSSSLREEQISAAMRAAAEADEETSDEEVERIADAINQKYQN